MRRILLATAAFSGLAVVTTFGAAAAPQGTLVQVTPSQSLVTDVDYHWNRHHWHHRHWERRHWRYYD